MAAVLTLDDASIALIRQIIIDHQLHWGEPPSVLQIRAALLQQGVAV
jgi:hypothetical protein